MNIEKEHGQMLDLLLGFAEINENGTSADVYNFVQDVTLFLGSINTEKHKILNELLKEFNDLKKGTVIRVRLDEQIEADLEMKWIDAENCDYALTPVPNPLFSMVVQAAVNQYVEEAEENQCDKIMRHIRDFDEKIRAFNKEVIAASEKEVCDFWEMMHRV